MAKKKSTNKKNVLKKARSFKKRTSKKFNVKSLPKNKWRKRTTVKAKNPTYDIYMPEVKTFSGAEKIISDKSFIGKFKPGRHTAKITVISRERRKSKRHAVTYIYDNMDEPFEVNLSVMDMLYTVYTERKSNQPGYLKRVRIGIPEQITVELL